MLLPVSVYLIPLFDLIAVPLSLLLRFILLCCALVVLVLVFLSGLCCTAIYGCLSCPTRIICRCPWFIPLLFLGVSLLNPFLATMFFVGYFHARFLPSGFLPACLFVLFCFSPTVLVPDLSWCNFFYLVITAGFVAYQLLMCDKQQSVRFCVILVFCFHLSFSCDIGEPGMSNFPLFFLGS